MSKSTREADSQAATRIPDRSPAIQPGFWFARDGSPSWKGGLNSNTAAQLGYSIRPHTANHCFCRAKSCRKSIVAETEVQHEAICHFKAWICVSRLDLLGR